MEEKGSGPVKNSCCYNCLCKEDINPILSHKINGYFRFLFKTDTLYLCYFCKNKAEQAEMFIETVKTNQDLLWKIYNITNSTVESKTETQPLTNQSPLPPDNSDLDNNEAPIEESTDSSKEVKVKLELKEEDNDLNLDDEYVGDDDVADLDYVKEEDEYPLKLLKEELELEGIKIKCLKKTVKKAKVKKGTKDKKKTKDTKIKELKIETLYITKEQCMEERTKMAADKKYINSVFKCEDCIKGFSFKASYDKHMEKHYQSNGDYECDICKQIMASEEKLHSHQRYHYVRYKCCVCKLTRISRHTIKDHYTAIHCEGDQYRCPHCSKTFNRQVSLRKHVSFVHKHKERVKCAYCSKTYSSKEALKAHLMVRHPTEVSAGNIPKLHVCQDCGMAFNAPSRLRNHSIKHTHRRDYYCVECDKSFKSDSILKHHLKTAMPHTNYIELPLPCQHCDKRFSIRRDLERHTNGVHLNIKPFQCDKCDKAYINLWSLNEHKRLVHEGYKRPLKFPCPMCDKVFDRNQILKGHIRTHTGERPYQCSKCPAQFSQASILGTHVKLIHLKLTRDGRPKNSNAVK